MKQCKFCKKPGKFDRDQRRVLCNEHNTETDELEELVAEMQYRFIAG